MVGLPGTGLGGVFYALLVLWMAVREGWMALLGMSDRKRWKTIGSLGAIVGTIVLALWVEGWLIKAGLEGLAGASQTAGAATVEVDLGAATRVSLRAVGVYPAEAERLATQALVPAFAVAPFLVLALLLAALHWARLAFPRQSGPDRTQIRPPRPESLAPLSLQPVPSAVVRSGGVRAHSHLGSTAKAE